MIKKIITVCVVVLVVLVGTVSAHAAETALTFDNYHKGGPKWSPDGNWIVYSKTDATGWSQIYKISASGGSEIQLTNDSYGHGGVNWSPDGNWIVYMKTDATTYGQVYKVPSGGGAEVALTSSVTWVGDLKQYPEWSPDGNWIAFSNDDTMGYRQIYKVSPSGGPETALTSDSYNHSEPHWTNDSQYIYYNRLDPVSGYSHIYKVPVSGEPDIKVTTEDGGHGGPHLSKDGTFFVFTRFISPATQLFQVSSSGGAETQLSNAPFSIQVPRISPNGQYVCYSRQKTNPTDQNIYHIRIADAQEFPVTSDSFNHFRPRWSPDGTKFTYYKQDATGYQQIYVADFVPPKPLIPTLSDVVLLMLAVLLLSVLVLSLRRRAAGYKAA